MAPELFQGSEKKNLGGIEMANIAMLGYGTVGSGVVEFLNSNKDRFVKGMQDKDALKAAQELGFAEADPSSDVLGLDSERKLSILSTMAFQRKVDWKEINAKGIIDIDSDDFRFAKGRGCSIKLLAISKMAGSSVYASVAPVMVRVDSRLGGIHDNCDSADMQNLWNKESSWLLRVRSGSRIEVMKKLGAAFSNCSILAGEFGAEGDEVAAFVKAKDESQIDKCMDDLKNSLELKGFKKIMLLEIKGKGVL
jgi:homoserine dehydrogenase